MRNRLLFCQLLTAVLVFSFSSSYAQCDTGRYYSPIFTSERTQENVVFQSTPSLIAPCNFEALTIDLPYTLDVYEPVGDTLTKRPILVYAHGGGFIIGDKRIVPVPEYCHGMAQRGFVVVSLDYRKCFNALSTSSAERAVYRAIQDMKAAIRWVKSEATSLKIDTNYVFAGGNSAGSIMALHSAYVDTDERPDLPASFLTPDLGCLDCSGNTLPHTGRPIGLINLWGAIADTTWIELANNVPILSIHGDADIAVFPESGKPFSDPIFPILYGSIPIHRYASSLGITSELHLLPGENHEPWLTSAVHKEFIIETSGEFLNRIFMKPDPLGSITGEAFPCLGDTETYWVPLTSGSTYCWNIDGGTMVSSSSGGSFIDIVWETPGTHTLAVREFSRHAANGDLIDMEIVAGPAITSLNLTRSGDTLSTDPGFTYQWYKNGWAIPGANDYWIVRYSSGVYSVVITDGNGCAVESEPFPFVPIGVGDDIELGVSIYPNPVEEELVIEVDKAHQFPIEIQVVDVLGRKLLQRTLIKKTTKLQLLALPAGVYFVRIGVGDGWLNRRVIKQ